MAKRTSRLGIYEELGAMMRAAPFRPFEIRTADGDTIQVVHPDFVARSPLGDTAIIYDREGHHRVINLHQVVTMEPTRPKGGPPRPGKR